ncbi:glycosyltransferase family 4 protein [Microbacterium tenebrionis]|uniref:glycosyltransferase family 4 protein n=1 Tax=Microbacterium tenebrionis TaxID=2830665 RepID=UPI001589D579|nr:glycosyltransferase family 4 protein [Microbacterium ihumii]
MARILWVSVETPDREGQGGQRRQFHQINGLVGRGHEVQVISLHSDQSISSIETIAPIRRFRVAVRGRSVPMLVARMHRAIVTADADAVVVSHVDSRWMLPSGLHVERPVLLDVHNVLSTWYDKRGIVELRDDELEAEQEAFEHVTAVMTCSALEAERLRGSHPQLRLPVIVAPLGVDPREWPDAPLDRENPIVAAFGNWSWHPNRLGLEWLLDQVWPSVREHVPDARLEIAGTGADPSSLPGVAVLGRVDDLVSLTASATVVAVPVFEGLGASVKFAESLATGAAVAATPDGANGVDSPPCLVSADPGEWAEWIVARLRNRRAEAAPAAARSYALAELTWAQAVGPIDAWIRSAADPRG